MVKGHADDSDNLRCDFLAIELLGNRFHPRESSDSKELVLDLQKTAEAIKAEVAKKSHGCFAPPCCWKLQVHALAKEIREQLLQ